MNCSFLPGSVCADTLCSLGIEKFKIILEYFGAVLNRQLKDNIFDTHASFKRTEKMLNKRHQLEWAKIIS